MTEKDFWKKIRREWPGHAMRVEASEGGVDPGTPDTNLSINGHGGWVELKVWPEPVSPIQIAWHLDALEHGATVEVWSWLGNREGLVWRGSAERYEHLVSRLDLTGKRERPRGLPLQMVIEKFAMKLS